jgi:hypothetical protein
MPPKTSRPDFDALVRRAALPLSEAQSADIHAHAWPYIEAMVERIRGTSTTPTRDRAAEPAHIFKPEGA